MRREKRLCPNSRRYPMPEGLIYFIWATFFVSALYTMWRGSFWTGMLTLWGAIFVEKDMPPYAFYTLCGLIILGGIAGEIIRNKTREEKE